jgi:hypothetical protein
LRQRQASEARISWRKIIYEEDCNYDRYLAVRGSGGDGAGPKYINNIAIDIE